MNYFLSNNYKSILIAALSFYIAYITGTGTILNYIEFADPLNEMAIFVLCITTTILSLSTLTFKK